MYAFLSEQPDNLFGRFARLRRELDDAFGVPALPSSIRSVAPGTLPAINVGHTPTTVEVYAFAPGLDASKVEVSLDRGVLRIAGERASSVPANDPEVHVYARERGAGKFSRTVSLPDDVDPGQVEATYRDGVLRISVRRREAPQPKRINIQ